MLKRHLTPDTFGKILRAELMPDTESAPKRRGIPGMIDSLKGLKVRKMTKKRANKLFDSNIFWAVVSLLAALCIWVT